MKNSIFTICALATTICLSSCQKDEIGVPAHTLKAEASSNFNNNKTILFLEGLYEVTEFYENGTSRSDLKHSSITFDPNGTVILKMKMKPEVTGNWRFDVLSGKISINFQGLQGQPSQAFNGTEWHMMHSKEMVELTENSSNQLKSVKLERYLSPKREMGFNPGE